MTENLTPTIAEFIEDYLPYTVRDLSVQREEVWDALKKQGYISTAIVGTGKFTPIHICELEKLLKVATQMRDLPFIKRLEQFITKGKKYAHLDGGNRCDCFLSFFDNLIKCSEGDYRFLAHYDENGEVVEEEYNEFVEAPMFAYTYRLSTTTQSNDKGSWNGYSVNQEGATEMPIAMMAKDFMSAARSGDVQVKEEHQRDDVKDTTFDDAI